MALLDDILKSFPSILPKIGSKAVQNIPNNQQIGQLPSFNNELTQGQGPLSLPSMPSEFLVQPESSQQNFELPSIKPDVRNTLGPSAVSTFGNIGAGNRGIEPSPVFVPGSKEDKINKRNEFYEPEFGELAKELGIEPREAKQRFDKAQTRSEEGFQLLGVYDALNLANYATSLYETAYDLVSGSGDPFDSAIDTYRKNFNKRSLNPKVKEKNQEKLDKYVEFLSEETQKEKEMKTLENIDTGNNAIISILGEGVTSENAQQSRNFNEAVARLSSSAQNTYLPLADQYDRRAERQQALGDEEGAKLTLQTKNDMINTISSNYVKLQLKFDMVGRDNIALQNELKSEGYNITSFMLEGIPTLDGGVIDKETGRIISIQNTFKDYLNNQGLDLQIEQAREEYNNTKIGLGIFQKYVGGGAQLRSKIMGKALSRADILSGFRGSINSSKEHVKDFMSGGSSTDARFMEAPSEADAAFLYKSRLDSDKMGFWDKMNSYYQTVLDVKNEFIITGLDVYAGGKVGDIRGIGSVATTAKAATTTRKIQALKEANTVFEVLSVMPKGQVQLSNAGVAINTIKGLGQSLLAEQMINASFDAWFDLPISDANIMANAIGSIPGVGIPGWKMGKDIFKIYSRGDIGGQLRTLSQLEHANSLLMNKTVSTLEEGLSITRQWSDEALVGSKIDAKYVTETIDNLDSGYKNFVDYKRGREINIANLTVEKEALEMAGENTDEITKMLIRQENALKEAQKSFDIATGLAEENVKILLKSSPTKGDVIEYAKNIKGIFEGGLHKDVLSLESVGLYRLGDEGIAAGVDISRQSFLNAETTFFKSEQAISAGFSPGKAYDSVELQEISKKLDDNVDFSEFFKKEDGKYMYFSKNTDNQYILNNEGLEKLGLSELNPEIRLERSMGKTSADAEDFYRVMEDSLDELTTEGIQARNRFGMTPDELTKMKESQIFEKLQKTIDDLIPCM